MVRNVDVVTSAKNAIVTQVHRWNVRFFGETSRNTKKQTETRTKNVPQVCNNMMTEVNLMTFATCKGCLPVIPKSAPEA